MAGNGYVVIVCLFAACLFIAVLWLLDLVCQRLSRARVPPGPRGIPLLGNLFDIPAVDSHIAYFKMAKKYGPILHFTILGRPFVIVSSVKIANELLDKRGAIYSDRPPFPMSDASGYEWNLGSMPHDEPWRARRKLVYQKFYGGAAVCMRGLLRRSTLELARSLIRSPHDFRHHIQRQSAANIMRSVYGITIAEEKDPYVDIVQKAMDVLGEIIIPGSNPVDMLPFLLRIPAWIPILGYWTKYAKGLRKYPQAMVEIPYARAKEDLHHGIARPCMVTEDLELMQEDPNLTERIIKDACAVAYFGGADTTAAVILAFVMSMVLWPELQRKAHAELDRVLGDRLPEFDDARSLPFVEAIIRETYRLFPVAPLAVPHAVERDDVYEGMIIRKGTVVMPNVWAIMRDENIYEDPHEFNPERWLKNGFVDPDAQDPRAAGTFGFGRRACPGRHFGDASVFISIATLLKCFVFGNYIKHGREMPPSGKIRTGILSCPAPFKCTITPRSGAVLALVELALDACDD